MPLAAVITNAPALTPMQIYQTAVAAGFPSATAIKMTAIALRESNGYPGAYNGNTATGDNSYGLWQINLFGSLGPARMAQFGITDPKQLLDPAVNAKAAYSLWGGDDANLNTAWAIDKGGQYTAQYQGYLPVAEQAAAEVEGTAGTGGGGGGGGGSGIQVAGLADFGATDTWLILGAAALLALIMLYQRK